MKSKIDQLIIDEIAKHPSEIDYRLLAWALESSTCQQSRALYNLVFHKCITHAHNRLVHTKHVLQFWIGQIHTDDQFLRMINLYVYDILQIIKYVNSDRSKRDSIVSMLLPHGLSSATPMTLLQYKQAIENGHKFAAVLDDLENRQMLPLHDEQRKRLCRIKEDVILTLILLPLLQVPFFENNSNWLHSRPYSCTTNSTDLIDLFDYKRVITQIDIDLIIDSGSLNYSYTGATSNRQTVMFLLLKKDYVILSQVLDSQYSSFRLMDLAMSVNLLVFHKYVTISTLDHWDRPDTLVIPSPESVRDLVEYCLTNRVLVVERLSGIYSDSATIKKLAVKEVSAFDRHDLLTQVPTILLNDDFDNILMSTRLSNSHCLAVATFSNLGVLHKSFFSGRADLFCSFLHSKFMSKIASRRFWRYEFEDTRDELYCLVYLHANQIVQECPDLTQEIYSKIVELFGCTMVTEHLNEWNQDFDMICLIEVMEKKKNNIRYHQLEFATKEIESESPTFRDTWHTHAACWNTLVTLVNFVDQQVVHIDTCDLQYHEISDALKILINLMNRSLADYLFAQPSFINNMMVLQNRQESELRTQTILATGVLATATVHRSHC